MSKQSAVAYLEKLEKDEGFKKRVAGAKDDKARWDLIKKAGFDFTKDEMRDVLQEKMGRKLTDEELDNVAGGAIVGIVIASVVAASAATAASAVGTIVGNKTK